MRKVIKVIGILFVIALCGIYFLPAVQQYSDIPDEIFILKGSTRTIDIGLPMQADVESTDVVNVSGDRLSDVTDMQSPLVIESVNNGDTTIDLSIFGIVVKTVNVNVSDEIMVIPGGRALG